MSAPAVSVILPTYNRAGLLPAAVASVLTQSFKDLELIVVDDGSHDETERVVRGMNDSRIVYLRRATNGGVATARNAGIKAARGRWLAFQDSDDEWVQEKLQLQVRSLQDHGAEAFSVGTVLRRLGNRVRRWSAPPAATGISWACTEAVAYCQALLVPTALMDRIGGFDEGLKQWEDWDLLLRLLQHGTPIACEQAWAVSTRQPDSLTQIRTAYAAHQGRVIDKHRTLLQNDRRNLARLEYVTARYALECGQDDEAVRRLRNCLRSNPAHLRAAAFLALAVGRRTAGRMSR